MIGYGLHIIARDDSVQQVQMRAQYGRNVHLLGHVLCGDCDVPKCRSPTVK